MFFIIGLTSGRKDLGAISMNICSRCGSYGRLEFFMTFTQLLLFFIPCFKWNKKYYARSSCCQTIFEIDPELGRCLERGEEITLTPGDLHSTDNRSFEYMPPEYICDHCGYRTREDFTYCPKCGNLLRRSQEG